MRPGRCRVAASVLAATSVLATAALAGCGSDGVPAKTWAGRVCRALVPWTGTIRKLTRQTQRQMATVTTPDQAKITLVSLLDQEADASGRARDRLLAAGVPDVDNGATIAREFRGALANAQRAYGTARDTIHKLPTTSSDTFYNGVRAAIRTLNKQYDAGALDTDKVSSQALQQAFDTVPECQ